MRYDGLDLNLLVALDALLRNRNVSITADQLGLSQPAMSGYLGRLREYFGDELLCSAGRGRQMALTHRAQSLVEPVRQCLLQIRATITRSGVFEPASSERHFRIAASHYAIRARIAKVLRHVAHQAPGLTFTVSYVNAFQNQLLNNGEIDILITLEHLANPQHPSRVFLDDEVVVAAWSGNQLKNGTLDEDQFFSLGHVVVEFNNVQLPAYEDWIARASARTRRREIAVPSFSDLPYFLIGTNRLGVVQGALGRSYAQTLPLRIYPMPFELPRLQLMMQWNDRNSNDPGLTWLVNKLAESDPGEI
jgi:DNA-binding transcriptional LysR family regulator